jgi:hypothetical protein
MHSGFGESAGLWSCAKGSRAHSDAPVGSLESCMTVLVFTSPVRSDPSLGLLQTTLGSFAHVAGLGCCRLVVVCDGFKVRSDESTKTLSQSHAAHQGKATADGARAYCDRIKALQAAIEQKANALTEQVEAPEIASPALEWVYPHWEILRLPQWHGYGAALRVCASFKPCRRTRLSTCYTCV